VPLDTADQELPLAEALVRWTDPASIAALRAEEQRHLPYHVHEYYRLLERRLQLSRDSELRQPAPKAGWGAVPDMGGLTSARRALERDLQIRIERGEFHLRGVRTMPTRETVPSSLQSAWAADFQFDFHAGRVSVGVDTYVAVAAVKGLAPALPTGETMAAGRAIPPITEDNVRELADDEVLLLLEDHARRVVENHEAPLIQPSKVSFGPIILRKMRLRAERGELLGTLTAETQMLAAWIQGKSPSHLTPTAAALENSLRTEYWLLKPQSKPMKA
jgi:hypothetical protein